MKKSRKESNYPRCAFPPPSWKDFWFVIMLLFLWGGELSTMATPYHKFFLLALVIFTLGFFFYRFKKRK